MGTCSAIRGDFELVNAGERECNVHIGTVLLPPLHSTTLIIFLESWGVDYLSSP